MLFLSGGMLRAMQGRRTVWSFTGDGGLVTAPISGPDKQSVSQPLTGLGAGQGLLVVPAGNRLVAYSHCDAARPASSAACLDRHGRRGQ